MFLYKLLDFLVDDFLIYPQVIRDQKDHSVKRRNRVEEWGPIVISILKFISKITNFWFRIVQSERQERNEPFLTLS